jgi:hypothetical protein
MHFVIQYTHIKTPTCFGKQVPFSGSYYNKSVLANVLINVPFIVISLIKTSVVKIHKIYNIDGVNILQCFDIH